MILSIKERLHLRLLCPEKGNILQQILVKEILDKIKITIEEAEEIELKKEGQSIGWNNEKAKEIDVSFSIVELNLLKDQVNLLDKENKITQENIDLCLKIKNYDVEHKE